VARSRAINFGIIPVGSALAGVLGETVGSRAGVAAGIVGMAASALPMLPSAVPRLRRLDQLDEPLANALSDRSKKPRLPIERLLKRGSWMRRLL
jgi:hypothetical protein